MKKIGKKLLKKISPQERRERACFEYLKEKEKYLDVTEDKFSFEYLHISSACRDSMLDFLLTFLLCIGLSWIILRAVTEGIGVMLSTCNFYSEKEVSIFVAVFFILGSILIFFDICILHFYRKEVKELRRKRRMLEHVWEIRRT